MRYPVNNTMFTTKIFCCGDGYAHGHIWPEWPQLLQCLLPDAEIEVISAVGAGNEYLISELLCRDVKNSTVIFQWPESRRFDKLLEDKTWDNTIDLDPVYHFNRCYGTTGTWWCSSASQQSEVAQYHSLYIGPKQANVRESNAKKMLSAWIEQQGAQQIFTSTFEQEQYSRQLKFKNIRGNQIQPHPLIHFWFLVEKILPQISLKCSDQRIELIKQRLESVNWEPYHPDRQQMLDELRQ